jgi:homogentisate 1,2-dioxygenase
MPDALNYMSGFNNEFSTEAIHGALPVGQNNPQLAPMGLYAEQLSGTAFTAPRGENKRTWFYRIVPSVGHSDYQPFAQQYFATAPYHIVPAPPDQFRWDALEFPSTKTDFFSGIRTICASGSAEMNIGSAVHLYVANESMGDSAICNHDGDFLIVPQSGGLVIRTECGVMNVMPGEIAVIPRGFKFQVNLVSSNARGYICENYGLHFDLPYRGPIGANGLANERDFLTPVAAFVDEARPMQLVSKFLGSFYKCELKRNPFDVVAWHGNYYPYKYDLAKFNTMNTVSFDHPDPSIFTVLTSATAKAGTANIDFVIFPPRWMVAEKTFRPPYYHRNIMSEYMGLVHGVYDAKPDGGFVPGGGSLHNCMSAHGPDAAAFNAASNSDLKPIYQGNTLAFMFESSTVYRPTRFALEDRIRQKNYLKCWDGLNSHFAPPAKL